MVRMHRHSFDLAGQGVFRPQPDGLIQLLGFASGEGATSFLELAPWLCPNLPHAASRSRHEMCPSRRP